MLRDIPQRTGQPPPVRAFFPPSGKRTYGLLLNVSGSLFWASAACSAPQWGSWVGQVGQAGPPPWLSLADKQVGDCELTSRAPGRGLSDAIGTVLA